MGRSSSSSRSPSRSCCPSKWQLGRKLIYHKSFLIYFLTDFTRCPLFLAPDPTPHIAIIAKYPRQCPAVWLSPSRPPPQQPLTIVNYGFSFIPSDHPVECYRQINPLITAALTIPLTLRGRGTGDTFLMSKSIAHRSQVGWSVRNRTNPFPSLILLSSIPSIYFLVLCVLI